MIKKRRILSILLMCCMLLTMVPAGAWAGEGDTFQAELAAGDPLTLCTFKVLTPPADGEPGTVQIGDGYGPAIDSSKGGLLEIPKEVVNGDDRYIVTEIGYEAFIDCDYLEGTLTIPNTIIKIQSRAFWGCDGVLFSDSSVVSDGLTGLQFEAGSTLTDIGEGAFYNCNKIGWYLEVPASVRVIDYNAFYRCLSLERVVFEEDGALLSIGGNAFANCFGIGEELILPQKIASIGAYAFSNCGNLSVLRFTGNDLWTDEDAFGGTNITTVCIPNSWSLESYPLVGVGVFPDVSAGRKLVKVPAIGPVDLPEAVLDQPYTYAFTASGTEPFSWVITGPNTWGITIDSASGVIISDAISGGYGLLPLTVSVSNAGGTDTKMFHIPCYYAQEGTPAASINYADENLFGLSTSAAYLVNGLPVSSNESGAIDIPDEWFGTTIELVRVGRSIDFKNSEIQSIALGARPDAPSCTAVQPSANSATGSISGITSEMKYSTDAGINWTKGNGATVIGVAPGTVLIRVDATADAPAGRTQEIVIIPYVGPAPPPGGGGSGSGSPTPILITKIDAGEIVSGTNVDRLVKEGKVLTVEGKSGEKLVFDTEALKNINGQTKDNLKVEIKDVSTDHNNKLPGKLVISLTLTAGGKKISNFGSGTATISLPYELQEGEKAEDVTVWYLSEDGTMSEVHCSYDPKTQMATFKVNHFSLYVVGTDALANWVNPFGDIKESHWFYEAVRFVSANKLMQGTTETAFDPKGKTTRGMIVTTLWRMENQPKAVKESTFTDVKSGKYYHDAVAWAAEKGIVSGYSADKFGPEVKITREQLAVILHNYATGKGYKIGTAGDLSVFSDAGAIHQWGKEAMAWANGEGLINGTGNNLLNPAGTAERGQVAAILQRFVENIKI